MKNINWKMVVAELLDILVVTEKEFADICGVSRQTVSNWKHGRRKPGVHAKKKLLEIVGKNKISVDQAFGSDMSTMAEDSGNEVKSLVKIYGGLPESGKKELMSFARFKVSSTKKK